MRIVWRVSPEPTGAYRSFNRRGWPMASFIDQDGPLAATLHCSDEYVPKNVKLGNHDLITVFVYDHSNSDGIKRLRVKKTAESLAEAKSIVEEVYKSNKNFLPKDDWFRNE